MEKKGFGTFVVFSLVGLFVLAFVDFNVYGFVVKLHNKVHSGVVAVSSVKPDCAFAAAIKSRNSQVLTQTLLVHFGPLHSTTNLVIPVLIGGEPKTAQGTTIGPVARTRANLVLEMCHHSRRCIFYGSGNFERMPPKRRLA